MASGYPPGGVEFDSWVYEKMMVRFAASRTTRLVEMSTWDNIMEGVKRRSGRIVSRPILIRQPTLPNLLDCLGGKREPLSYI